MSELRSTTPESVNASVGWFTIVITGILIFFGQDADSADALIKEISSGKYTAALAVLVPQVVTPIQKILNKKNFSWDFLRSWNFRVQVLSAILLLAEWQAYSKGDGFLVSILGIIGGAGNGFIAVFILQLINTAGRSLKQAIRGVQA